MTDKPQPIEEQLTKIIDFIENYAVSSSVDHFSSKNYLEKRQEAKHQILSTMLPKERVVEAVGNGEIHISHVCPIDSTSCAEFHARGKLRHQILKDLELEDI